MRIILLHSCSNKTKRNQNFRVWGLQWNVSDIITFYCHAFWHLFVHNNWYVYITHSWKYTLCLYYSWWYSLNWTAIIHLRWEVICSNFLLNKTHILWLTVGSPFPPFSVACFLFEISLMFDGNVWVFIALYFSREYKVDLVSWSNKSENNLIIYIYGISYAYILERYICIFPKCKIDCLIFACTDNRLFGK